MDTFKATVQYSMLEKSAIVLIVAGVLLLVLAAIGVYGSYTHKVSVMNMVRVGDLFNHIFHSTQLPFHSIRTDNKNARLTA